MNFHKIEDPNKPIIVEKKYLKELEEGLQGNPEYGSPRSGLYYVIPAMIMDSNELEPMAKLLYALLSGLSDSQGMCFPSDAYLEKRLSVSKRQIQDLLEQLEKFELVRRETHRTKINPFLRRRKIFILMNFKKCLPNAHSCTMGDEQVCTKQLNARAHIESKAILESEDPPLPPPKPKTRKPEDANAFKKRMISSGYTEKEMLEAWQRYLKTPEGTVKHVNKWIETTLNSIRLENEAKREKASDQEKQSILDLAKARESFVRSEGHKKHREEINKRTVEQNMKLVEEYKERSVEGVDYECKKNYFRLFKGPMAGYTFSYDDTTLGDWLK